MTIYQVEWTAFDRHGGLDGAGAHESATLGIYSTREAAMEAILKAATTTIEYSSSMVQYEDVAYTLTQLDLNKKVFEPQEKGDRFTISEIEKLMKEVF